MCARFGGGETHKSPHKIFEYDDAQLLFSSHRDNYFTYRYAKHYVQSEKEVAMVPFKRRYPEMFITALLWPISIPLGTIKCF